MAKLAYVVVEHTGSWALPMLKALAEQQGFECLGEEANDGGDQVKTAVGFICSCLRKKGEESVVIFTLQGAEGSAYDLQEALRGHQIRTTVTKSPKVY